MFVFLWHNNIGFNHLNSGTYFITKLWMIRRKIIRFISKPLKGLSLYTGLVFMVFNATFSNISVILQRSVLLVEETGVLGENRAVASHWQFYHIMLYTSPWSGFELTSVVIGMDCIGSCKSNYHVIMATTAPYIQVINHFLKINDFMSIHSDLPRYCFKISVTCNVLTYEWLTKILL